jgi:hypothetical protein
MLLCLSTCGFTVKAKQIYMGLLQLRKLESDFGLSETAFLFWEKQLAPENSTTKYQSLTHSLTT